MQTQERAEEDETTEYDSPWFSRIWGVVYILCGVALCVALVSFHVNEIGWSYLNKGPVAPNVTNILGIPGLYGAGLAYWVFGAMVWVFIVVLEWWGIYRLCYHRELPRGIVLSGWGLLVCGCIICTVGQFPAQEWVTQHQLQGAGGLIGHLAGANLLQPLLGDSLTIILAGVAYVLCLIYVTGLPLRTFLRASWHEYKEWRQRRKEKRLAKENARLERESARIRNSMAGTVATTHVPRRTSPPLPRTGDDLDDLRTDLAAAHPSSKSAPRPARPVQEALDLPPSEPKITIARQADITPTSTEQPFSKIATPPVQEYAHYQLPPFELLHYEKTQQGPTELDRAEMLEVQQKILETFATYKVHVTPGDITRGPTITRYEFYPARGVRVNIFANYDKDIALATKAARVNILAPIPGKDTIGVEIVNRNKMAVPLRELLQDPAFCSPKNKIPLALGKDVYGHTVIGDLAAMPHLLVAGATGSGKSVCINSIIASMLLKFRPDELKLILVDPKVVEMQPYANLPHLCCPVITDPKKVLRALQWCVNQMEHRYHCFAQVGVRNFDAFNKRPLDTPESLPAAQDPEPEQSTIDPQAIEAIADELENPGTWSALDDESDMDSDDAESEDKIPDRFHYIVIIIDELADLMQSVGKEIEGNIARLTQKARAAGIHLIVATQTPRRQVLTGTIKANIPTRIAFQVAAGVDSQVILDHHGAEKLIGKGDLLYLPPGAAQVQRAQGAFITDEEVAALVEHCVQQAPQNYDQTAEQAMNGSDDDMSFDSDGSTASGDEAIYQKCVDVAVREGKVSTSLLQRRLAIGYGKAARMMDLMEERGVVGPQGNSNRPRDVLI